MSMPGGIPVWPEWCGFATQGEKPVAGIIRRPKVIGEYPVIPPGYRTQIGGVGYILQREARSEKIVVYRYDRETEENWEVSLILQLEKDSDLDDVARHFPTYLMEALL